MNATTPTNRLAQRSTCCIVLLASLAFFATWLLLPHEAHATTYFYPQTYLASLYFDGTDYWDTGEKTFPMQGTGCVEKDSLPKLINTYYDLNNDGWRDVEEATEVYIPFALGYPVYGTSRDSFWISSIHPNNQRPAVYFNGVILDSSWKVYQYWLYYPDNDWYAWDHEHDWEHYDIYVRNNTPQQVRVSTHNSQLWNTWQEYVNAGLCHPDTYHLMLSVCGGSHAFHGPVTKEDGVQIRYDGAVAARGGKISMLGSSHNWRIYCNNPYASGVTKFTAAGCAGNRYYYFYGDPTYGSGEWSDGRLNPWLRWEWTNPPSWGS